MTLTIPEDQLATGGIPTAPGGQLGGLVERAGQVQYGDMLLGGGTSARWRELVGWRDTPDAQASDTDRPQAHGAYAGDVFGGSLAVTFTFLVRGTPEGKLAALEAIEDHAPLDGVERPLVVDDGAGPSYRLARVIGRNVPMDKAYRHGPVECSVQWLCADPRRYGTELRAADVELPTSSGGLDYPLDYPLSYGRSTSGAIRARNRGSVATPVVATFYGPLTDPQLVTDQWRLAFTLTLADGESLVVDTSEGTALLNGSADRLYTLRNTSDPLERCLLPRGVTNLSLTAPAGSGRLLVTYRDARL